MKTTRNFDFVMGEVYAFVATAKRKFPNCGLVLIVVIGTEPWLKENIGNAEVFRADFTTFRRDRSDPCEGGDFYLCSKFHCRYGVMGRS